MTKITKKPEIPLFEKAGQIAEDIIGDKEFRRFTLRTIIAEAVMRGFNYAVEQFDVYEEHRSIEPEVRPALSAPPLPADALDKLPTLPPNPPMKKKAKRRIDGVIQPSVYRLLAQYHEGLTFPEMRKLAPGFHGKSISNAVYRMRRLKQVEQRNGKWVVIKRTHSRL